MKKEELKKINQLVREIDDIRNLLRNKCCNEFHFSISNCSSPIAGAQVKSIVVDRDILEPFLIDYCNKLNAELKKLGYEE